MTDRQVSHSRGDVPHESIFVTHRTSHLVPRSKCPSAKPALLILDWINARLQSYSSKCERKCHSSRTDAMLSNPSTHGR